MINGELDKSYRTKLSTVNNQIIADLKERQGGEDSGMDPHELLEASLSACTIMTLQMYAKKKGFFIGELSVEVKIEKEGEKTLIEREVHLDQNLSDEIKQKLKEIADKCPIHKLLTSDVKIESRYIY